MKLKFTQLLGLFAGALLMVLFGTALIVGVIKFNLVPIQSEGQGFFTFNRIALMLVGFLMAVFGAFCFTLPSRMKQSKADFVLQQTPSGEMRISVQALVSIIQKSLSQYEEIKLQDLQVHNTRRGVEVDLRASIAKNINIPLAVNAVQKHVKQQLLATSGIDVREVRVIIEKADQADVKSSFQIHPSELNLNTEAQDASGKNLSDKEGNNEKV